MYKKIFLLLLIATITATAFAPMASSMAQHSWAYVSKTRVLFVKASLPNNEMIKSGFINIVTQQRRTVIASADVANSSVAKVSVRNVKPGAYCSFTRLEGVSGSFYDSTICFTVKK